MIAYFEGRWGVDLNDGGANVRERLTAQGEVEVIPRYCQAFCSVTRVGKCMSLTCSVSCTLPLWHPRPNRNSDYGKEPRNVISRG
jgi:hypothetical protein